jgi:hypothetical protein
MGDEPRTAFACTGGPGAFEREVRDSVGVVVVEVIAVGGPEVTAPTVTPTPVGTPFVPLPSAVATPRIPPLLGVGARLRVERVLAGDLGKEFDIDTARRRSMEQQIRRVQADPNTILPCAIDFLVERYAVGERYLILPRRDDRGGLFTSLRLRLDGEMALISSPMHRNDHPRLLVSAGVRDEYFAGLPSSPAGQQEPGEEPELYFIESDRVPVAMLAAAVEGILASPPPTQPPIAPPGAIRPPDTGSAGLR